MHIPKMQASPQYRVTIPKLDGGVNLKDAPHLVEDNQLTDVCNMWWQDQALRTRPGLKISDNGINSIVSSLMTEVVQEQARPTTVVKYYNGIHTGIFSSNFANEGSSIQENMATYAIGVDGSFKERIIDFSMGIMPSVGGVSFISHGGNDGAIYAFSTEGEIYALKTDKGVETWRKLDKNELYAPLILVNGRGADSFEKLDKTGTFYESPNMLTGKFKAWYTTDGKASEFRLPFSKITHNDGETTVVRYTDTSGNEIVWTFPPEYDWEQNFVYGQINGKEILCILDRENGTFGFSTWNSNGSGRTSFPLPVSIQNGLKVESWKTDRASVLKICRMQFSEWFGGDRSGLNGGSWLFVSGNREHKNLVHWSDLSNPLYFPENNYAYIGDASQSVTTFGKQADSLVIFKEHEILYATYVAGGNFTAQDVIDGRIIDVAANMAKFPITPIHSSIGCDCPHTVQLCGNRLVWATTARKVYTLVTMNQYNEKNVYELSGAIDEQLCSVAANDMKEASSCDWKSHYLLLVNNHAFVLNYGGNAFTHVHSYTNSQNANRAQSWYVWDFPECGSDLEYAVSDGERCVLIGRLHTVSEELGGLFYPERIYRIVYSLETGKQEDDVVYTNSSGKALKKTTKIHAMFQTKLFDFGHPERRKNIRRLHIGATDVPDGHIALSYNTEYGTQEDAYRIGMYGDGSVREWAVTPFVNRVRQFGVRAESDGAMAIDGMVIRYEVNGEVR